MNYFKVIMVIARSEGGNDYCFQQIHQQFLLLDQEKISKESQQKKKEMNEKDSIFTSEFIH